MENSQTTPNSNADNVALNLVMNAIVGEINTPGQSLAELFDRMSAISRNIGGDYRAASTDWKDFVSDIGESNKTEIKDVVNRQERTIAETWAQQWMLMQLAKRLYQELEMRCIESPAATAIEKIVYDDEGRVLQWMLHSNAPKDGR